MLKHKKFPMVVLAFIVVLLAILRIWHDASGQPATSFSPLGAVAILAGVYFGRHIFSYTAALLILLVSDILMMKLYYPHLSQGLLYAGWPFVYLSFIGLVVLAQVMLKKVTISRFMGTALFGAILQSVVADTGVWFAGGLNLATGLAYSADLSGYLTCLANGLPYMKNLFLANIIFGGGAICIMQIVRQKPSAFLWAK